MPHVKGIKDNGITRPDGKKSHNRARKDFAAYAVIGPDGRHVLIDSRMQVFWMKRTAEEEAERMRTLHGNPDYTVEDIVVIRPSVGQKNG